jgi:pimeloyl-ACP methyl ester carboxylesterase
VTTRKILKLASVVSISALVLAGCAPSAPEPIVPDISGAPTGFNQYYEQVVEYEECGTRLYCADIEVPMDWNDSNSEAISIATVFRLADSDPKGFILFNPGGPGASGYDWVKDSSEFLGTDELRSDWNILGFDPRGVGRSSAVECLTDSEYDEFLYGVSGHELGSEEDIAVARAATADFASKCLEKTGPLLEFVDTVSAAKDMDVLRAVVGEFKLNFLGYSYGSFLGTTYATLFPDRVGRFVLDGAIDPTVSEDEQTLFQLQAFEAALTSFLKDCETYEDCPFSGDVAKDLELVQQMLLSIEQRPLPTSLGRELTIWGAVTGLIMTLYSERYGLLWPLHSVKLYQVPEMSS